METTASHFGAVNTCILAVYLLAMLAIGWHFAKRQKSTTDYFLAGRKMPWLPVAMSMFASLTSAVTFMGLPAMAYHENVALLVVCIVVCVCFGVAVPLIRCCCRREHALSHVR